MTDRGSEYCGRFDKHDFQLFLAINDIDHTKTKVKSPHANGILGPLHKTILQEFCQITFCKKLRESNDELLDNLDDRIHHDNHVRTHQGKMCCARTPIKLMVDGKEFRREKVLNWT